MSGPKESITNPPEAPQSDTSSDRDEITRFLSAPERVQWTMKTLEYQYELTVPGVGTIEIAFDSDDACTGYAEFTDEATGGITDLDQEKIDAVCDFINEKLQPAA